jgi:peptidyl-prolyl cis-trans isomerase D
MALITKIRERSGLAVTFVALAMILFIVGGDLLSGQSKLISIFGGNSDDLGSINGHTVTIKEYQGEIDRIEAEFNLNQNKTPSESERQSFREQAWNELVSRYAYKPQWEKAGIDVTKEEQIDMVQGENIHPSVKQAFTDPKTQQFDRQKVKEFLAQIPKAAQKNQDAYRQYIAWTLFENKLPDDRRRTRYENMMSKTNYVTMAEAKREYESQTAKADVKYLYIPYTLIADSTIKPSDDELQAYINENKKKYKGNDAVTFDYIQFKKNPSAKDSAFFREELEKIKTDFAASTEDSVFAAANSDVAAAPSKMSPGDLPADLKDIAGSLQKGQVVGPIMAGGNFTLYKVINIANEGLPAARASHILIKWASPSAEDKKKALDTANMVLKKIQKGMPFEIMAMKYGGDGTAQQGGDLGWFTEGRMVPKFQEAVFAAPKGLIAKAVETEFGYHIIKVTETKTTLKYNVVSIQKQISPSTETDKDIFSQASVYASKVTDKATWESTLKENPNVAKQTATSIQKNSYSVNDIQDGREIVRWAFNDAKPDAISRIFDLKDRFVLAIMTRKTEEGKPTLDGLRDIVKSEVIKKMKAEQIIAKLSGATSIDDMAKKYGTGAIVNTSNALVPSASSMQDIGYDPAAIGTAFGLKDGKTSKPMKGESGVYVVQMVKFNKAPDIADYNSYKAQAESRKNMPAQYAIMEGLKGLANVKDNRIKNY